MKFSKWLENRFATKSPIEPPAITSESTFQQLRDEIQRFVSESISYLKEHPTEEDRIEAKVGGRGGIEIKVWHTRINTEGKFHLGFKSPWETSYTEISVENLIEFLVKHQGSL